MMTLKELKNLVKPADPKKRVPCAVSLKQSGARIVVREAVGLGADITVYANGYVLYQEGEKTTVFPLHACSAYGYESVTGQQKIFRSDFFDNENWFQEVGEYRNGELIPFGDSPEWFCQLAEYLRENH